MVRAIRVAVGVAMIFIVGCTQIEHIPNSYSADQYSAEITRLEAALLENPDAQDAWRTHLKLAALYRSHQNPAPNYEKALFHLEQYFLNESVVQSEPELGDWRAALNNLSDLKREARELANQNQELTKTINILKKLDQGVEEKRKSYAE